MATQAVVQPEKGVLFGAQKPQTHAQAVSGTPLTERGQSEEANCTLVTFWKGCALETERAWWLPG